jgi:chorismate synthase
MLATVQVRRCTTKSFLQMDLLRVQVPGLSRPTNRAGGLEGGVTNGELLRVTAWMNRFPR